MKNILLITISALLMVSCGSSKSTFNRITLNLKLKEQPESNIYRDLDYGVRLNVLDKRTNKEILSYTNVKHPFGRPVYDTYPEVKSFVEESMTEYMQTMGFSFISNTNTDYLLQIEIMQFELNETKNFGTTATVSLNMRIFDSNMTEVYPQTTITGRSRGNFITSLLNRAYADALDKIDWNGLAGLLRRAKLPSQEKNKQVKGDGDTALEHTVIRWFIDSSPKGADVHWRIVSSTPNVKNTNQTYLGTTPYESTETFDIKGLTFNNSGDVQIEISCDKVGYHTQKRRFNLRQAIEQKEISTKFNLVKEEN